MNSSRGTGEQRGLCHTHYEAYPPLPGPLRPLPLHRARPDTPYLILAIPLPLIISRLFQEGDEMGKCLHIPPRITAVKCRRVLARREVSARSASSCAAESDAKGQLTCDLVPCRESGELEVVSVVVLVVMETAETVWEACHRSVSSKLTVRWFVGMTELYKTSIRTDESRMESSK
ncbi:hypothetical protein E2C01_022735 [Portunus trituberculatus]|uniref:Uncharacterized protein n=1 Tax=Portunus trituberculatus TaxID=210409 RepID=A0A5B7E6T9_PORTR|nr:hypothetical protein [Portunus trituberculatus]